MIENPKFLRMTSAKVLPQDARHLLIDASLEARRRGEKIDAAIAAVKLRYPEFFRQEETK